MQDYLTKIDVRTVEHPPYSPDLAPADFFFFPKVKSIISGISIEGDSVRPMWENAAKALSPNDFQNAYERWIERFQKCIRIGGGYVEK